MAGFGQNISIGATRGRIKRRLTAIAAGARAELVSGFMTDAEMLAGAIKAVAPKEEGDLIASVEASELPAPRIGAQVAEGSDKAYYARWVEHGTIKMTPRPHFWPVYRAYRKPIKARSIARVRRAIKNGAKVP